MEQYTLCLTEQGVADASHLSAVRDEDRTLYPFGELSPDVQGDTWTLGNDILLAVGGYWEAGSQITYDGTFMGAASAIIAMMHNEVTGRLELYEAYRLCVKQKFINIEYPGDDSACELVFEALALIGKRGNVIHVLQASGGLTIREVSERLECTYPTAHRALSDLEQMGIVTREIGQEISSRHTYIVLTGSMEAVTSLLRDFFNSGEDNG